MTENGSLAGRAALALSLMIGFYALGIGISLALLWIPYAEFMYTDRVHLRVGLACVAAAGAILWALLPRIDKFEPPGPLLTRGNTPRLHRLIDEVARGAQQEKPAEVYLLNEVNAWVSHRGGVMGLGSRRVMGIGLPLMQALTVTELKAVLAHEFGHYHSGDVGLGPWIYKTRAAIGRTLEALGESILSVPFAWYARQFMTLTMAVSQRQEFVADEVAARIAGAAAAMRALTRVATVAPAYSTYLYGEVESVLQQGFLPPVLEGFDRYLKQPQIARLLDDAANQEATTGETGEFDSHPSLKDRLEALAGIGPKDDAEDTSGPAAALLGTPERYSKQLLEFSIGRDEVGRLKPIDWTQVGDTVYAARWRQAVEARAKWFGTLTTDQIPIGKQAFSELGAPLADPGDDNADRAGRAGYLLTAGLGQAMLDDGWAIETAPGEAIEVTKGDRRFDPRDAIQQLADGMLSREQWVAICEELGIAGRRLAGVGSAPAAASAPARAARPAAS